MLLTSATSKITVTNSAVGTLHLQSSYVDWNGTTATPRTNNPVAVTTATTTDLVPATGNTDQRKLKEFTVRNTHASVSQTVNVNHTDGTNSEEKTKVTLAAGKTLSWTEGVGFQIIDANGSIQVSDPSTGRLLSVSALTSGTTFTTSALTSKIKVRLVAGGGGGGGVSSAASSAACGAGGGGGAFAEKLFTVTPNTAYTYAIGAAGVAGANTGGTGGTGGSTTFTVGATTVTANGGVGGVGQTAAATEVGTAGGAGGAATLGDFNVPGQSGDFGWRRSGTVGWSGAGGPSQFGDGGAMRLTAGAGNAANGFGGGGGGGLVLNASAAALGGVGTAGQIVIEEYA